MLDVFWSLEFFHRETISSSCPQGNSRCFEFFGSHIVFSSHLFIHTCPFRDLMYSYSPFPWPGNTISNTASQCQRTCFSTWKCVGCRASLTSRSVDPSIYAAPASTTVCWISGAWYDLPPRTIPSIFFDIDRHHEPSPLYTDADA